MKYQIKSNKHRYELTSEKIMGKEGFEYYLISEIYLKNKFLDKIILGFIDKEECSLNSGRFINFSKKPQEHQVQIAIDGLLSSSIEATETLLDLLGRNSISKWNLYVWITSFDVTGKTIYDFSFENMNDAIMLKLLYN